MNTIAHTTHTIHQDQMEWLEKREHAQSLRMENDLIPDMLSYYSEVDEPKEECKRYDYTTRGRFQWLLKG